MRLTVRKGGLVIRCQGEPLFIVPDFGDGDQVLMLDGRTGKPVQDNIAAVKLLKRIEQAYPDDITREIVKSAIDIRI